MPIKIEIVLKTLLFSHFLTLTQQLMFFSVFKAKEKFSIPPETNMYVLDDSGTEVDEEVFSDILEEKADILWTIVNVLVNGCTITVYTAG